MTDSAYGPDPPPLRRRPASGWASRRPTTIRCIGAGIDGLLRPSTQAVYMESPGSLTFEMQDVPAIAAVAHRRGALVILDNTWATPLLFKAARSTASTSRCRPARNMSSATPTRCSARSPRSSAAWARAQGVPWRQRALRRAGRHLPRLAGLAHAGRAPAPPRGERARRRAMAARRGRRSPACCTLRSSDDPGHADLEARLQGLVRPVLHRPRARRRMPRWRPSSTISSCSGSDFPGAASRASPSPSTARASRTATAWDPAGPAVRLHIGLEDPQDLDRRPRGRAGPRTRRRDSVGTPR